MVGKSWVRMTRQGPDDRVRTRGKRKAGDENRARLRRIPSSHVLPGPTFQLESARPGTRLRCGRQAWRRRSPDVCVCVCGVYPFLFPRASIAKGG